MSNALRCFVVTMGLATVGLCGCQSTGSRFLSLIGLQKEPLAVALVVEARPDAALQVVNPFTRYAALQNALQDELGRPVTVEPCLFLQGDLGLSSGWYQLGIVSPAQYAQLSQRDTLRVLAVPLDREGRAVQRAVLIVAAGSTLQHVTDLRGQVVAFGPPDDSLTHHAALQLLQAAGLAPTDLALEALPVPGSLKHFPNTRATAQSVINGSSQAGFVPEADWAALPAQDAREGEPARGKLRVIAETTALPARLIVASVKMDDATAQRVREALVSMGARRPAALEPLEIAGYTTPGADVLAACRALQVAKPGAAPAETAEAGDTKHN